MNKSIINSDEVKQLFSSRATLAALGVKMNGLQLFGPVTENVKISQKKVKYTPTEKLMDGLIAILSGAHGLLEINKRVRSDRGLQAAFGRKGCAEQSVVQNTLDACVEENVIQMQGALDIIYCRHSQGYRHNYKKHWQLLDVDMTGRPCGKKADFASKGYFAKQRNRRGRQEGYLIATHYEEIVTKQLFDGKTQLTTALRPLVKATEKTLGLEEDEAKRQRTILRVDSGGGSMADVNWVLARGYHFHGKDYSGVRARILAESVAVWFDDPQCPERQVGWVTAEADAYCRSVKRIAVRCRKNNGQWGVGVLISTLSAQAVLELMGQTTLKSDDTLAVLLAYVYFYDQRGGGVETEIKEDKQGLGTSKRNKKRFHAQQMVTLLETLAHNILVWARRWLSPHCPKVAQFGILRLVRDAFHMNGVIHFRHATHVMTIILNRADPLAYELSTGLAPLLAQEQVAISLGEI